MEREKEMLVALGGVLTALEVAHLVAFRTAMSPGNVPTAKHMIAEMIEEIRCGRRTRP